MFLTKLTTIGTVLVLGALCAGSALVVHARAVGVRQRPTPEDQTVAKTPPAAGDEKAKEPPDLAERWLKAAQRPGLSAREKAACEQIAKLHLCEFEQVTWVSFAGWKPGVEANESVNALLQMGFDVLPQLAEALDDTTPTKTVTTSYSSRFPKGAGGYKKVWLVNEFVGRLIFQIASHDFVLDPKADGFPPGIRDLNTQPHSAVEYKKAVLDWYAANPKKSPAERKIDDVNDLWFRNRFDALEWLGENKIAAGRRPIEKRIDALFDEARTQENSLLWSELSACGLALGKIGDKEALPQVRAVCRFLTHDDRWATGGAGPNPDTLFEAAHGRALLGEKDEALRELEGVLEKHPDRYQGGREKEFRDELDKARRW